MKNDPHDLDMISQDSAIEPWNYKIDGLKIKRSSLDDPKYRYITYTSFFCEIIIATDDMGTQICYDGIFFGGTFFDLETAVIYLRYRTEVAKILFRKVYLQRLRQKFTWRNLSHQYWRVRHYFDPNFYLGR